MYQYLNKLNWVSHFDNPMYLFKCGYTPLVYKLVDNNDIVVYVGKTHNGARRISSHNRDNGYEFSNIYFIEVLKEEQKNIEKYLIKHYKPKYNTQHNK